MQVDRVSNGQLCAFLDGECGRSERRRIEHALTVDADVADRLNVWRRNDAALRAAFPPAVARKAPDIAERARPTDPLQALERTRRFQRATLTAVTSFIAGALCATGAFLLLEIASGP